MLLPKYTTVGEMEVGLLLYIVEGRKMGCEDNRERVRVSRETGTKFFRVSWVERSSWYVPPTEGYIIFGVVHLQPLQIFTVGNE